MSTLENPVLKGERVRLPPALPEHAQPHLPNALGSLARWLGHARARFTSLIVSSPERESLPRKIKGRAVCLKEDHPARLLGVMMGAAFAIGIAARIWSPYER